ncbi:hypothetical protein CANCADRAFT_15023, partial [Tortispora caseinolytica NRRL Y-17796]
MEKLLKWSLNASNGQADGTTPDPELIAQLFGSPDDTEIMKRAGIVLQNESSSLEEKEAAFDDLQMLVEQVDNANNMVPLGLWPVVLQYLDATEASLRRYAAWVVASAVQNNDKAQEELAKYEEIMKRLLVLAADLKETDVSRMCLLAISSLIGNCESEYSLF